jgi:hypothetical protein
MEEAVEICKLRLFLKLVAQVERVKDIEPLPDIDFNIRAGNTLVGYATYDEVKRAVGSRLDFDDAMTRIEEKAQDVDRLFALFRQQQTELGGEVTPADKQNLRNRLKELEDELNRYLAEEYQTGLSANSDAYAKWLRSHKPFHWFIEFYGIIKSGGFDVIIGNPPYVDYAKVRGTYRITEGNYSTLPCGNLYAFVTERAIELTQGHFGVILPLSSTNANGNSSLQMVLRKAPRLHISHYAVRPSKLFVGVDMNLTIVCGAAKASGSTHNTTSFMRWSSVYRPLLFSTLEYATHKTTVKDAAFPKFGQEVEVSIWNKLASIRSRISTYTVEKPSATLAFHGFGRYWRKCIREKLSDNYQEFQVATRLSPFVICLLNSQLSYWYWIVSSDCYRFTKTDALNLPVPQRAEDAVFTELSQSLLDSYEQNSVIQRKVARNGAVTEEKQFFPSRSKPLIDEIDRVLASHYGFTDEELDFIINYDIKYRMGREAGEDED